MVTVKINEDSKQARALVEMLRTFPFVEFMEKPRYNKETEKAIVEARTGKAKKVSLEDFRKQLLSE
jgi:uncharacterized protein YcgI (DUF1989 family)